MTSPPKTATTNTVKSPSKRSRAAISAEDSARNVRPKLSDNYEGHFRDSDDPFTVDTNNS